MLVVVVDKVVGRTFGGKKVCLVLEVVGRTVILGETVTVVRGSSVKAQNQSFHLYCSTINVGADILGSSAEL